MGPRTLPGCYRTSAVSVPYPLTLGPWAPAYGLSLMRLSGLHSHLQVFTVVVVPAVSSPKKKR